MVPLLIAGALLWYAYRDTDLAKMGTDLAKANWFLIILSIIPMSAGHILRAERWRMLLAPSGNKPNLANTFMAVMAGYFANLILPRMGEVTRCGVLLRSNKIPVNTSIGTVITERGLDLAMLGLVTSAALLLEYQKLSSFFLNLLNSRGQGASQGTEGAQGAPVLLYGFIAVLVLLIAAFFLFRAKLAAHPVTKKLMDFAKGLIEGVLSITKIEGTGKFILYSFLIWGSYYATTYMGLLALNATEHLDLKASLVILVVGSFGMVAPVQGGIGAFHYMVIAGLTQLYLIPEQEAQGAAFLLHTINTLYVVVVGGIAFVAGVAAKPAEKA